MRRCPPASSLIALALSLAGCASYRALPAGPLGRPEPLALQLSSGAAPLPASAVTCDWEQQTGSHLAHQVCRSQEERERDRLKAENLLHRGLQQGIIVIH